jgi:hypothetical protein
MRTVEASYTALRATRGPSADAWWRAVRRSRNMPPPISALLNGRTRIELTTDELDAVLRWAATVDGWADAHPKPLVAYPR